MRLIYLFILALATLGANAENLTTKAKVMSYNIRNGRGINNDANIARTAGVIMASNADVVAIQEVDSMTVRSGGKFILGELAGLTSMFATYAPAIDYDGGKYGLGILSRVQPISVERIPLPGREELRVLLVAEFKDYIFMATHLSLTAEDQTLSLEIIRAQAARYAKPVILAGDLNFKPDSEQFKKLSESFTILTDTRKQTFPADKPQECIDYIAGYAGSQFTARVQSSEVVNAPIESDHRPVAAELTIGKILRTNPYLQNPIDKGITVLWQTNVPTYSWVEWGADSTKLNRTHTLIAGQVISNNMLHRIRLNGVEPGVKYYYRICSREIASYGAYKKIFGGTYTSPFYEFRTPAAGETDFRAIVFNDLHQRYATMDALMKVVGGEKYDFVVFNGDVVDDPATESRAIGSISYFNDAVGASTHPVVYIRGNHEIRGAFSMSFTTLFDYVGGQSYGAMNWGDTRIVMLDCGEDKPDDHWVYYGLNDFTAFRKDQLAFLKKEHRSKEFLSAKKRILIHHIPLWGNDDKYNPCLDIWGAELIGKPYSFTLNGHTHRQAFHPRGSEQGNPFPVFIGGGPEKGATVMVITKKGNRLTLECFDASGKVVASLVD